MITTLNDLKKEFCNIINLQRYPKLIKDKKIKYINNIQYPKTNFLSKNDIDYILKEYISKICDYKYIDNTHIIVYKEKTKVLNLNNYKEQKVKYVTNRIKDIFLLE